MVPVLVPPASEWLLCLAASQICWSSLFLALQLVNDSHTLLCFEPTDNAWPLLSRQWVVTLPCFVYWCLPLAFQRVSGCCVSLHFMSADNACLCLSRKWVATRLCFISADHACSWLASLWVIVVPCCVSNLLMMPALDYLGCKWLLCVTMFQTYWWCLSLTI